MKMFDYHSRPLPLAELISRTDAHLRRGKIAEAREHLLTLLAAPLPRPVLANVVSLCRRLNCPEHGVRLLHPLVRSQEPVMPPLSVAERAEYAAVLARLGAYHEAEVILEAMEPSWYAPISLFRAFCRIYRWDYESALPWLRRFLATEGTEDYLRQVAEVNVVAALVALDRGDEARDAIAKLLPTVEREGNLLLTANLLELLAQVEIDARRWDEAERALDRAGARLSDSSLPDSLFLSKWQAIARLYRTGDREPIGAFRNKAQRLRHWESIRDVDYHLARATGDADSLGRLYFGTSHPSLRARFFSTWQKLTGQAELPERVTITVGRGPATGQIDMTSGLVTGRNGDSIFLKPGQLRHRTLRALSSDLYRPVRMAELHAAMYPGEHFSPLSSPGRVHQAVFRLNEFFFAAGIALEVMEERGGYRLETSGAESVAFVLSRPGAEKGPAARPQVEQPLLGLAAELGERPFGVADLMDALGVSRRTAQRYLSHAISRGLLSRRGAGNCVTYCFIR